jgi:predicted transcriptional regulator
MLKTPPHNTPLGRIITTRNFSQSMLAKEAGVSQSFLKRVAKGTVETPRRSNMQRLAKYLGIPVDSIYPE